MSSTALKISRYYDASSPDAPAVVRYDADNNSDKFIFPVTVSTRLTGPLSVIPLLKANAEAYRAALVGATAVTFNRVTVTASLSDGTYDATLTPVGGVWPAGAVPVTDGTATSRNVTATVVARSAGRTELTLSEAFPFPVNVSIEINSGSYTVQVNATDPGEDRTRVASFVQAYPSVAAAEEGISLVSYTAASYVTWLVSDVSGWVANTPARPNPATLTLTA